jgi:hypothetical protein
MTADLDALRITIKARRLLAHAGRLTDRDLAELRQALARAGRALEGPQVPLTRKSSAGAPPPQPPVEHGDSWGPIRLTEAEEAWFQKRGLTNAQ